MNLLRFRVMQVTQSCTFTLAAFSNQTRSGRVSKGMGGPLAEETLGSVFH